MDRTRLRAMLSSGSSITFDVRTRPAQAGEPKANFFDYAPLRRAMLLKVSDQSDRDAPSQGLNLDAQSLVFHGLPGLARDRINAIYHSCYECRAPVSMPDVTVQACRGRAATASGIPLEYRRRQ